MRTILLRRLRIGITLLSFIEGILLAAYYARFIAALGSTATLHLSWRAIAQITITIVVVVAYCYSLYGKRFLHRHVRAFLLLVVAVLWLYLNLNNVSNRIIIHYPYICPPGPVNTICSLSRAFEFLSIVCGFLVVLDVLVTLQVSGLEQRSKVPHQTPELVIVSPTHPAQQQFAQPYLSAYYSQQPQQPHPSILYPQHQTQTQYQHQPQPQPYQARPQQAQLPYSAPGHGTALTQVPGLRITATPQPGGAPVVPYPSPGLSVAVSPVLPANGYESP